jgi:hypothetical protein
MKQRYIIAFTLLFLIFSSLPVFGQGFIMKKDILVDEDETEENVIGLGGEVYIKGHVLESVIAFGGKIIIEGSVSGDTVLGFGADITLKSSAKINGDVVILGGSLERESGSEVLGDVLHLETFLPNLSLLELFFIFKLVGIFFWIILALLVAGIFPRQVTFASSQVRTSFWPVFGVGILGIILFSIAVTFSAMLSILLIGIPILLGLIFIGMAIKTFGRVVLFHFFGESIARAFGSKKISSLAAVMLGLFVVSLITLIPIIGSLFAGVLSILGWGVVIRTKFGTRENWFRKNQT